MQKKLVVLFIFVLLAFIALSLRLIKIYRDKGNDYKKQVLSQQQTDSKTTDVPLTLKGAIFTTEGHRQNGWSTANPGVK